MFKCFIDSDVIIKLSLHEDPSLLFAMINLSNQMQIFMDRNVPRLFPRLREVQLNHIIMSNHP